MVTTDPSNKQPAKDKQRASNTSNDSVAGALKEEEYGDSGSEDSDFGEDKASDELELLSLEDLDGDAASRVESTSAAAGTTTDAAPVKRIVRRKRKRMSEDERRVRHREVQRQFMKRKRARLAEMRKYLRGLDSQLRLTQAMSDRERLEKQNETMRELLASPGSGWQWDDVPSPAKAPQPTPVEHHQHQSPRYPAHQSNVVQLVPGHVIAPHGMIGFHPHGHPLHHTGIHAYPTHIPHLPHHQMYPHAMPARHLSEHRLSQTGVPLPWDDIFDAVSTDNPGGASHDFSF